MSARVRDWQRSIRQNGNVNVVNFLQSSLSRILQLKLRQSELYKSMCSTNTPIASQPKSAQPEINHHFPTDAPSEVIQNPQHKHIDDLHQDEQDDDPFQFAAFTVVHDVLKKLQIFFDDRDSLGDVSVAVF